MQAAQGVLWCAYTASLCVLGVAGCAARGSELVRGVPLYGWWRQALAGWFLVTLYTARALVAFPLGVAQGVALAAYLPTLAGVQWQLVWRATTNEYIATHAALMESGERGVRAMRLAYTLSRPLAAEALCVALGLLQGLVVTPLAARSGWAYAVLGALWVAAALAGTALVYFATRAEAVVASRRAVVRVVGVWAVTGAACAVLWAEGISVRVALSAGVVCSAALTLGTLYVSVVAGTLLRRGSLLRAALTDGMGMGESDNLWVQDPLVPRLVSARAWLRMIYSDDRVFEAWMRYLRRHHPDDVCRGHALRLMGLTEAGEVAEGACLTRLQLEGALPARMMQSAWLCVAENEIRSADAPESVFAQVPGSVCVDYLVERLSAAVDLFVNHSAELRRVALSDLQRRLACALADVDGLPPGGAYPSALVRHERDMETVLLVGTDSEAE